MKKFKSQKNCTDDLGNKVIFAEIRDTTKTTTKKRFIEGWPCRRSHKNTNIKDMVLGKSTATSK